MEILEMWMFKMFTNPKKVTFNTQAVWLRQVVNLVMATDIYLTCSPNWVWLNNDCSSCAKTTSWTKVIQQEWVKSLKVSCTFVSTGCSSYHLIPKVNVTVLVISRNRLSKANIWSYGRKYNEEKFVVFWICHWSFTGTFNNPLLIFGFCGWGSIPRGWLSYILVLWLYSHVVCLFWYHLKARLLGNNLWMILNRRGVECKSRSKSAQHETRWKIHVVEKNVFF